MPDVKVLDAAMEPVKGPVLSLGGVKGSGAAFVVNHNADPSLLALRYRLKDVAFEVSRGAVRGGGAEVQPRLVHHQGRRPPNIEKTAAELGLQAYGVDAAPTVKTHAIKAPRIAYVHTWMGTQDEGWWRLELDKLRIPYDYISTQTVAKTADLNAKYDVILFPPVGRGGQQVIAGMPMWGNPLPWKKTDLTPNIGGEDSTDDMRPGLGWTGLSNLENFVHNGGLLITADDTSDLAVTFGLTQGVSITRSQRLKAPGTVVRSKFVDLRQPDRLRLRREPVDLHVERPRLRRQQLAGRAGRGPLWSRQRRAAHGPRHGGRSRHAAGPGLRGTARRSRRRNRGRRCPSPTSSCATGSTSSP